MANFVLKFPIFCYHGNMGQYEKNFLVHHTYHAAMHSIGQTKTKLNLNAQATEYTDTSMH